MKSGDEIASLNEKTGRVVWSKVNALMDMGMKTTYRLRTEDGREIRTTANHPYLTRIGWAKVFFLRERMEIAVPNLLVFSAPGDNRGKRHEDYDQRHDRQEDIEKHQHNYDLVLSNHKLIAQNISEAIIPTIEIIKSAWLKIAGSATEAKATNAMSEAISASLFNWFSVRLGSMYSYFTPENSDVKWAFEKYLITLNYKTYKARRFVIKIRSLEGNSLICYAIKNL